MAWAYALAGAGAVLLAGLVVAVVQLWRLLTGLVYEAARRLDDMHARLDDLEAMLSAVRDDGRALDERLAAVEDDVARLQASPLAAPVVEDGDE